MILGKNGRDNGRIWGQAHLALDLKTHKRRSQVFCLECEKDGYGLRVMVTVREIRFLRLTPMMGIQSFGDMCMNDGFVVVRTQAVLLVTPALVDVQKRRREKHRQNRQPCKSSQDAPHLCILGYGSSQVKPQSNRQYDSARSDCPPVMLVPMVPSFDVWPLVELSQTC